MNDRNLSKFLSLLLRHKPQTIGLNLDPNGWADMEELLSKISQKGKQITFDRIENIVKTDNKQRYSFNEDKTKIRANQGHSVKVDLEFKPQIPPEFLFHGTATRFLDSIKKGGLLSQSREHVHLSKELKTAANVGSRHGEVVILTVKSQEMHEQGFEFYLSENGVWLTNRVPVKFIQV